MGPPAPPGAKHFAAGVTGTGNDLGPNQARLLPNLPCFKELGALAGAGELFRWVWKRVRRRRPRTCPRSERATLQGSCSLRTGTKSGHCEPWPAVPALMRGVLRSDQNTFRISTAMV